MDAALKLRIAAKTRLTRCTNKLKLIIKQEILDILKITEIKNECEEKLLSYDDAQKLVESFISDEDELFECVEISEEYREEKRDIIIESKRHLTSSNNRNSSFDNTTNEHNPAVNAKLPIINIPCFKGDPTNWQPFWDKFSAIIDHSDLSNVNKFSYLQSFLKDEALSCIEGLALTDANYFAAKELLQKRFGRKEKIIFSHIQKLLSISQVKFNNLWSLYDKVQASVRSLEGIGIHGDTYGVILTPMILCQLPTYIKLEWARCSEGKEGDLKHLLEFLFEEIQRRERSNVFQHVNESGMRSSNKPRPGSASVLMSTDTQRPTRSCVFCHSTHHFSDKCSSIQDLSFEQRKEQIRRLKLCFRCLSSSHQARECSRRCFHCKGPHHSTLHFPRRDGGQTGQATMSTQSSNQQRNLFVSSDNTSPSSGNTSSISNAQQLNLFVSSDNTSPSSGNTSSIVLKKSVLCDSAMEPPLLDLSQKCTTTDSVEETNVLDLSQKRSTSDSVMETTVFDNSAKSITMMQVVQTDIDGLTVSVLFDSGSDRSFVRNSTADRLSLKTIGKDKITLSSFGGQIQTKNCKIFGLKVNNVDLKLIGVEKICSPLHRTAVPKDILEKLADVKIKENIDIDHTISLDILIGLDFYFKILNNCTTIEATGLVLQDSLFGCFVSGCYGSERNNDDKMSLKKNVLFCSSRDPTDEIIRKAWELDSIGIGGEIQEIEGSGVLKEFTREIKMKGDRYEVGIPWKSEDDKKMLMNNVELAQKRLTNLSRKLDLNPKLRDDYLEVFNDLERQGIIEEIVLDDHEDTLPIFYLPHRPVVRENSQTTKVRPVFDASAKGMNGVSLNQCLNSGPNMVPDLIKVLMRFRRWKYGLTADITKAFLQIEIRKEDRDVHRFLLNRDDKVRHFRFTRVTFGNTASPFLLNATIKHHLLKFEEDRTVGELKTNLYVDDWITGSDDEEELIEMALKAKEILLKGSFPLAKWASNSPKFKDDQKKLFDHNDQNETQKVLGMTWNTYDDCFQFETSENEHDLVFNKRNVLSLIARQFDPLGLLTPFTVSLKILFQDIWRTGFDWDTPLPVELQDEIQVWVQGLKKIKDWQISRRITQTCWTGNGNARLDILVDASEKAYGSCVYLTTDYDESPSTSLVISKVRVAPLKKVTLPRLELLAALLGARLLRFVKDALKLPDDTPYTCWTDSKITEGWIKGDPSRWKQFVRNRVVEIQDLTSPANWKHVSGKVNTADLLTRGVTAKILMNSTDWLHGPTWLRSRSPETIEVGERDSTYESEGIVPEKTCPQGEYVRGCIEQETILAISSTSSKERVRLIDYERFSDVNKLIRIMSWVQRFIHNCKCNKSGRIYEQTLNSDEFDKGRIALLFSIQNEYYGEEMQNVKEDGKVKKSSAIYKLSPFLGDSNLLRVHGRLQCMPHLLYDDKHPIILPKCHVSYLIVKAQHILMKHAGVSTLISTVRNTYWIVSVRTLVKKVCKNCIQCQRQDSRPFVQATAPLPEDRVKKSPPFSIIGVDHAGPLYCSDIEGKKLYILLFTCAIVRAVHVELVNSLSLEDFLLALKRFAARRGWPSIIYSDNAKTFKGAEKLLKREMGHLDIHWKFNAPLSPWWGGFWERMIRSIKTALRKSLGQSLVTRVELETNLHEIEACINSRPLTYVEETGTPLSPSHFLIGRSSPFHSTNADVSGQFLVNDLRLREKCQSQSLHEFWEIWMKWYIRNLPPMTLKKQNNDLKIGTVVLVREEGKPRLQWPLAIVTRTFTGRDGLIRAVELKTSKGLVNRAIQLLHKLEVFDQDEPAENFEKSSEFEERSSSQTEPKYTRSGRCVKPVQRLTL